MIIGNELERPASGLFKIDYIIENLTITIKSEVASETYTVTLPSMTGFEIKAVAGYDVASVAAGSDFKFSVTPKTGYEQHKVTVYANNKLLAPSAGSIYTLQNVTTNQVVKIEATPPEVVNTYRVTWKADEGATLVPEKGYDENKIPEGGDFKFRITLDALHQNREVKVLVNGELLTPAKSVYTIYNLNENKEVTITVGGSVASEEIFANQVFISVRAGKLCIKHPEMNNKPLYMTAFNGASVKVGVLNGVYTEVDIPAKGIYIASFEGFKQKIIIH